MKNDFTFLSYISSKDKTKLTSFIRRLHFRIEIKDITVDKKGVHTVWFNFADHINPKDVRRFIDLDLDKGGF